MSGSRDNADVSAQDYAEVFGLVKVPKLSSGFEKPSCGESNLVPKLACPDNNARICGEPTRRTAANQAGPSSQSASPASSPVPAAALGEDGLSRLFAGLVKVSLSLSSSTGILDDSGLASHDASCKDLDNETYSITRYPPNDRHDSVHPGPESLQQIAPHTNHSSGQHLHSRNIRSSTSTITFSYHRVTYRCLPVSRRSDR